MGRGAGSGFEAEVGVTRTGGVGVGGRETEHAGRAGGGVCVGGYRQQRVGVVLLLRHLPLLLAAAAVRGVVRRGGAWDVQTYFQVRMPARMRRARRMRVGVGTREAMMLPFLRATVCLFHSVANVMSYAVLRGGRRANAYEGEG